MGDHVDVCVVCVFWVDYPVGRFRDSSDGSESVSKQTAENGYADAHLDLGNMYIQVEGHIKKVMGNRSMGKHDKNWRIVNEIRPPFRRRPRFSMFRMCTTFPTRSTFQAFQRFQPFPR